MNFTISTRDLQDGISTVTRALAAKPFKPAFEGIHAEASGNRITFTCSDGQMTARWTGQASIQEQGSAILPRKLLAELVRRLPDTDVSFRTDKTAVIITYGKARSRLSLIAGEFPDEPAPDSAVSMCMPAAKLKDLISRVQSCIAQDSTRLILTGALLEITPGTVHMVALDGFRLAEASYAQDTSFEKYPVRAVIPGKALSEIARILPSSDSPVDITFSRGLIRIDCENVRFSSTLLSGEYIDYQKLVPTSFTTTVRVYRDQLQDAIARASLLAKDGKNNTVRLVAQDSSLSVSAQSDTGSTDETLDCIHHGGPITIAFNASYISEAVRNAPDEFVTLNFNSPTSPVILTPDDGSDWMYLVLPVRVFN